MQLSALIGDISTEIPDDVVRAALILMEANCEENRGPTVGFYSPVELEFLSTNGNGNPPSVPRNRSSINIHHITGHWMTSYYDCYEKTVKVYDSLISKQHFEEIKPQLTILYGKDLSERSTLMRVTQQGTEPLCGVMAIAFAFCCFLGQDPMDFSFDIHRARDHLKNCIDTAQVRQFPLLNVLNFITRKNDDTSQEKCEKPELKPNNKAAKDLLGKYFEDQEQKRVFKQQHTMTDTYEKNTDELLNKMEKDKLKKRTKRSKMSDFQRKNNLHKDRCRKQTKRKDMTPEEKTRFSVKEKQCKQTQRQTLTEEAKSKAKFDDNVRKQTKRKDMTPEEKTRFSVKEKQCKQTQRQTLTEEAKSKAKLKEKQFKQAKRQLLKEDAKAKAKFIDNVRKQTKRKDMTPEEKTRFNMKEKQCKQTQRQTLSEEAKSKSKLDDNVRKQTKRKDMTPEEKTRFNVKEKQCKQTQRQTLTEEAKSKAKFDDNVSKQTKRRDMTPEEKTRFNMKEKQCKQTQRQTLSEEAKSKSKLDDNVRKQTKRKDMTPEEKTRFNVKEKQCKQTQRQTLSEEAKSKSKLDDNVRKQSKRKQMSPEEKKSLNLNEKQVKETQRQTLTEEQKKQLNENEKKRKSTKHCDDIRIVINTFKNTIKDGPNYACVSCSKFLFRRSVIVFNRNRYKKSTLNLIEKFLASETNTSNNDTLYICHQCDTSLKKDQVPVLCGVNGLLLETVPDQLKDLSSLELQLISKVLPFMKIVPLYTGAQKGIRGQVVLVPSDISKVTNSLPRLTSESQIITLALKRRLSDKHSFHKQFIRPQNVNNALTYLKNNSSFYSDTEINSQWETLSEEQNKELWTAITNRSENSANNDSQEETIVDSEDEIDNENPPEVVEYLQQKNCVNSNTCFQQIHGPNVTTDNVLNIAPAEGQRPTTFFNEKNWEALAFPKLFPTGKFTFNYQREKSISKKKYFSARLLHKDGRFSETTEYIFHALDILERQTLTDTISITTRKSYFQDISAGQLKDPNKLLKLLSQDQVYASFKNIRGTPQYWQQMQFDMLAKLRQLGPYTFFLTGSAAEFHWTEVIKVVARQYGTILSEEEVLKMDWNTKRNWLQRNPVTVARHIDYIFEQLWGKVILSGAHPIGEILNYDRRKEMQGRGTEHFHAAVHVKDAPKIDIESDEKCIAFINKYISCTIPDRDEDVELYDLVVSRQIHHHTRTCKKNKNKSCRFGYPRPPSPETLIARPPTEEDAASIKESAMNIQAKVYKQLLESDPNNPFDIETLLEKSEVSQCEYVSSLKIAQRKTTVIMQRMPSEVNVNNYNGHILRALRSNMDIQFIASIWGCIAYLTSYMCKPERTMSELMRKASKEASEKGIRDALAHIGNVFIKSREVSEHEAVSRILSLPLRRSNIDVSFIQTDYKDNRTRVLKSHSILQNMENDDTDLYLPSIHDKYAHRPDTLDSICLADFVANYSHASSEADPRQDIEEISDENTSKSKKFINLKDNMGKIYRRVQPRVIRYHYVSKQKDEEAYYHRLLVLYMPWRKEEDIPLNSSYFQRFEQTKQEIMASIQTYEPYNDEVEEILENFDPNETTPEIWNEVSAQIEQEQEEIEDNMAQTEHPYLDPEWIDDVNEPVIQKEHNSKSTFRITKQYLASDSDFLTNIRALNVQQRQIFDHLFSWATKYRLMVLNENPDPFYIFLSGGGGVGKTFTINTIYQGLVRALRTPGSDPEKPTVILTASTGKAAANINGTTLHSAFALPVKENKKKNVYKRPSMERLNSLRSLYVNLKVIIIDEISMIGTYCLNNLSCALQDIFQNHSEPFAGISILAVGDLLQLPPVGDRPVFKPPAEGYEALAGCLWTKMFKIHELTTIVRQQGDTQFAEILSRIRTGDHTDDDIQELTKLEQTDSDHFPNDTIHLYVTNKQVRSYNNQKLALLPGPRVTITARDTKKDIHTNTTNVTVTSDNIYKTGGLPQSLTIAKGARFLLTKNIDIADHLVNGVIGTIVAFDIPPHNPLSGTIYVKFDDKRIGANAKRHSPPHLKHAVPIKAVTARFPLSQNCNIPVERLMYPGVLAYGLSGHKAQGSTYDYMVVDFTLPKKVHFQQGQAYTMISRATARKGIKLINFTADVIKVNENACLELQRMRKESLLNCENPISDYSDNTNIAHLNIRTLKSHFPDLKKDLCLKHLSVLCLTETHTNQPDINLTGYYVVSKPTEHGLAIYIRETIQSEVLQLTDTNSDVEALGIYIQTLNLAVLVVYRPPKQPVATFFGGLSYIVMELFRRFQNVQLVGDFNMPVHTRVLTEFSRRHGFCQTVNEATHILGGILDLNFTSFQNTVTTVIPVPYTDHHLVCCSIQNI